MHAQTVCLGGAIGPGRGFGHVGGLRQLHLDGVQAFGGAAIVAGCPAALETAVGDAGIARRGGADRGDSRLDARRAGSTAVGADVEIRQRAVEQIRDLRADRVAIIKDGVAVDVAQAGQLCRKCGVIGRVIGRATAS